MDDPIFDAIVVLCQAAENDGFVSVADALELCLDVYLLEREQRKIPDPIFRSVRADISAWTADLEEDTHSVASTHAPVAWSSHLFPLSRVC